jgi:hypothetical protein
VIAVTATGKSDFVHYLNYLIESGSREGVSVSLPGGLSLLWWSGRIFEGRPQAPMNFPDPGRPVFISRDAKLEAHDKRGTG